MRFFFLVIIQIKIIACIIMLKLFYALDPAFLIGLAGSIIVPIIKELIIESKKIDNKKNEKQQ